MTLDIANNSFMAARSRLVVLLTPEEKREVRRRAQALGMNVSEYVRTMIKGNVEDTELEELLQRTKDAAEQSIAMIDETLAFVNASNARMAAKEASSIKLASSIRAPADEG